MACARSRIASTFSTLSVRLTAYAKTDPPACGFWINLHQMARDRSCHIPLLGRHVRCQHAHPGPHCASYPMARSLPRPSPHRRTFPAPDIHWKQGHAFASLFSRHWSLLKEEKDCLCGYPGNQQESAGGDSKHQERAEIVIIGLPAQRAFFFQHALRNVCSQFCDLHWR
jgi:hypothetical protein